MEIYKVGGFVRDSILGIDSKDVDYVVVNSSEQEMLDLGFSRVGEHFPVFLHPITVSKLITFLSPRNCKFLVNNNFITSKEKSIRTIVSLFNKSSR